MKTSKLNNNGSARFAPIGYEDGAGFHCDHSFMVEYRRRLRRDRLFVAGMSLLALAGGILAILLK